LSEASELPCESGGAEARIITFQKAFAKMGYFTYRNVPRRKEIIGGLRFRGEVSR
jgi:hypothetical protein